ncbi:hypothetical protein DPMN_074681 [Dreissena polymorpha]|uniref:Uncharacterized protein n=1 Tax=Dreissena polymorpha TaxID=45954 RepID=A0A9D4BLX7_DREPO|nr:hypothetical protein DPMN_074681 [Dreissena polymorpha]
MNIEPSKRIPVSTSKNLNRSNESDQTALKSLVCDENNPNINLHEKTPARGRPRDPRSLTRAEKRTQSAKPYNRQGCKSRECSQNRQPGLTVPTKSNVSVCNSQACEGGDVDGGAQGPMNSIFK